MQSMRTVFVVKTFCDYEIAGPYKNYALFHKSIWLLTQNVIRDTEVFAFANSFTEIVCQMSFWNTASLSQRISSSVLPLLRALCKILPAAQAIHQAWCVTGEGSAEWEQMWPKPHHLSGTLSHPQSTFISNHLWHIWLCEGLIWWYPLQLHHIAFASCPGAKTSKDSKPALPGRARGWPPRGQPLASGGQELVRPVSRPFWDPFYRLFNLCQWAWAPGSQSSDQYTVEQNFPVFCSHSCYHFPK